MPSKPLPEVTEAEAAGVTAEIFADIKNSLHVEMVNLIYRHLAAVPAGLEWAWCSVRPLVVDGSVQEAALQLTSSVSPTLVDDLGSGGSYRVTAPAEQVTEIRRILDSYNRANPQNLIIVLCLQQLLREEGGQDTWAPARFSASSPPSGEPAATAALPPMIEPSQMAASLLDLAATRSAEPPGPDEPVLVPSLYRHLARWPDFLGGALTPLASPPSLRHIRSAQASVERLARAQAHELLHLRRDRGLPSYQPPAERQVVEQQLARFADGTIAGMIVIGHVLASYVDAAPASA